MSQKISFQEFQELVALLVPDAICHEYANERYDAEGLDISIQYDDSYAIYP